MMSELRAVQKAVTPSDTLLVVDAMTGQEAAGLVRAFNDAAPLTGQAFLGDSGVHKQLQWFVRASTGTEVTQAKRFRVNGIFPSWDWAPTVPRQQLT